MQLVFYIFGGLLVGVTLGLLGSGGSILTVPILVYLLHHDRNVAIGEGLAIVAVIALAGALPYARANRIVWSRVFYFGIPGFLGAYWGVEIGGWLSGSVKLLLLACIMFGSAVLMIRPRASKQTHASDSKNVSPQVPKHALGKGGALMLIIQGVLVGLMTGIVGVGGGFLIVPALVLMGRLGMHLAVGTSLMIIFLNSGVGFMRLQYKLSESQLSVDWWTILWFSLIGMAGAVLGGRLNKRLPQNRLRQGFAMLLVLLGSWIIISEAPRLFSRDERMTPQLAPATFPVLSLRA